MDSKRSSSTSPLRVWLLSPYHTGSHASWARGLVQYSAHRFELLTMAGRFWKWRMQGGAMELAAQARQRLAEGNVPNAIVATDMVNLPAWLGLLRRELPPGVPILYYMHENQLTYPPRPGEKPDLTYAMFNWSSQLCAEHVAFNSRFHRANWFAEVPKLLKHFPDYNHLSLVDRVQRRSSVLPVGIAVERIMQQQPSAREGAADDAQPPLIVWNQRWEYDKRPDRFFRLLYRLQEAGIGARPGTHSVVGQSVYRNKFGTRPEDFPVTTALEQDTIALPLHNHMTGEDVARVADVILRAR